MERIRKALDLAREERIRLTEPTDEEPVVVEARLPVRVPAAIRFTKTRSFLVSSDLLEANRIIDSSGSAGAAAAFRMLRTQVLQRMEENGWRSIAVVSPGGEDGKTTTAINLAASLAGDQRHTVLLVDFDFKRPTIAKKLGLSLKLGSDDVLMGNACIEDCLFHPKNFDRLVVLPARGTMGNSSEVLAGPRCRDMVVEMRGRYSDRIVVFDLPPVLGGDDALAFSPLVECVLVVVAEGLTRREDLLRSMELLHKTPVIGTVLNRATDVASAYG